MRRYTEATWVVKDERQTDELKHIFHHAGSVVCLASAGHRLIQTRLVGFRDYEMHQKSR